MRKYKVVLFRYTGGPDNETEAQTVYVDVPMSLYIWDIIRRDYPDWHILKATDLTVVA